MELIGRGVPVEDGPARTRTWARRIMSPLLYRLSYRAKIADKATIGCDASSDERPAARSV